ncbi:MFS transporter [Actinoplanes sp. NPDC049118]|uniref:MFS transporter n=1 Tax=Actinoplanes sp. NPDC049118 TaxID=3155769 RepID=UPI0033F6E910
MVNVLTDAGTRLWAPARQSSFRMLWLAQAFSLLGDGVSYIAFAWVTLNLTGSSVSLAYVLALQAIPRALLTLVGGSLSDRWSTRRMMTLSSWARSAVMIAVGSAALTGSLTLPLLCVAAAVFGAVDAFFQPARASILPTVVSAEQLTQANSLLGVGSRVAAVAGPAVGGLIVAGAGGEVAFLIDGLCFALCGLFVTRLPAPAPASAPGKQAEPGLLDRIREGLHYVWQDPRIRTVLVVDMAVTFCYSGPFTVGLATMARNDLTGGSVTLGVLNGALAGGAMLGTLVGGLVGKGPRVGLLIAALAGWLAVGMVVLSLGTGIVVAVGTVLSMGFAIGFQGVYGLSWIQGNIPGDVLSRVISVDMVFGYAIAPLSLVLCGAVASHSTGAMFAMVAAVLALTALGTLASPSVREMR